MNAKFFVPYETAKALQIKGYPNKDGEMRYSICGDLHRKWLYMTDIVAPTYHEVIDWLERFFNKYVSVYVGFNFHTQRMEYCGLLTTGTGEWSSENFPTREEALNAAILKALEMI